MQKVIIMEIKKKKKKYYKDKVKAFNIFGTHYSLSPYNDKYNEKNYTKIKEILNSLDKTQAKTWYQTSLRKYFSKDEKKQRSIKK